MARTLTGIVSSDKREKTITVTITSRETHPVYKKQYTVTRKYSAHDEKGLAKEGDRVVIAESRPFSKTKNWVLVEVLDKSHDKVELKDEVIGTETKPESEAKEGEKE